MKSVFISIERSDHTELHGEDDLTQGSKENIQMVPVLGKE